MVLPPLKTLPNASPMVPETSSSKARRHRSSPKIRGRCSRDSASLKHEARPLFTIQGSRRRVGAVYGELRQHRKSKLRRAPAPRSLKFFESPERRPLIFGKPRCLRALKEEGSGTMGHAFGWVVFRGAVVWKGVRGSVSAGPAATRNQRWGAS